MDRACVVETHISVLVFLDDRVWKLRKPVHTPFLDFSTREQRLADCRREVALNRRLAPDVYLGVHDVVDENGEAVEHLVVMRRLPSERRLASMIAGSDFDPEHLRRVARRLAAFHASAERSADIDHAGSVEHLRMLWSTNLDETEPYRGTWLDASVHARVRRRALAYLEGREPLLQRRVADGRMVDGHGDLLAEDVFCLDDGPRILDCLEFDAIFRHGDVLYDTTFLAMDLERLGRADLARAFLDDYREFSAETHPESLEHWYIAYRALVRAKIACLRAETGASDAAEQAATLLTLADRHLAAAEVHVVLVGGLPGTGKTTLARGIADHLGWGLLRSDEVRKELAGLPAAEHAWAAPFAGPYAPGATATVYRELMARARTALGRGDSVVLDATWLDPAQRAAARELAQDTSSTLTELCCVLDVGVAEARIRARATHESDASDATPDVLAALAEQAEVPWPGALAADTSRPAEHVIEDAVRAVLTGGEGPGSEPPLPMPNQTEMPSQQLTSDEESGHGPGRTHGGSAGDDASA